jgi:nucleoid DNA-binding protein
VTKKEIVGKIASETELPQLTVKDVVEKTFKAILDTLLKVGRIELRNFGVFEVKQRKPRRARNPLSGERIDVPKKIVVTFKPGKEMEDKIGELTVVPKPPPKPKSAKSKKAKAARAAKAAKAAKAATPVVNHQPVAEEPVTAKRTATRRKGSA